MRRSILFLMAIIVLTFSACNADRYRESTATGNASADSLRPQSTPIPQGPPAGNATDKSSQVQTDARQAVEVSDSRQPSDISLVKASAGQSSPEAGGVERKIIRNAELTIETQNPEESFRKVASLAESKGGFVVTSEATQPEGAAEPGRTTVTVVIRIPAAQFDATAEEIRKIGDRVLQDKRTGQDVTEEYIDLQARLQAKKALEAQFLEIMKRAREVSDALEVERELSEVRSEIEQIEGRRRFLENQASLSTIKVSIVPPVQIIGTGGGIKEALRDGVSAASVIILVLVRVVIVLLPLVLLVGLPIWLITKYWIRRAKRTKLS